MRGAYCGGVSPLADCEIREFAGIADIVDTSNLLPAVEASVYLASL